MTVVTFDLSRKMGHPSQNHSQAEIVPKNRGWAKKGILYPTDWFIFEGANGVRTKECTLFNPDHPLNTEEAILSCSELEVIKSLEPRPPSLLPDPYSKFSSILTFAPSSPLNPHPTVHSSLACPSLKPALATQS